MKTIRKIKALGLSDSSMKRLTAYCSLLSSDLIEQWRVVNAEEEADLLIIDDRFLENQTHLSYDPNATIVCSKNQGKSEAFPHLLEYPLNSKSLKTVLNQISRRGKLQVHCDTNTPDRRMNDRLEVDKQANVGSFADRLKEKLKHANERGNTLFKEHKMTSKILMH